MAENSKLNKIAIGILGLAAILSALTVLINNWDELKDTAERVLFKNDDENKVDDGDVAPPPNPPSSTENPANRNGDTSAGSQDENEEKKVEDKPYVSTGSIEDTRNEVKNIYATAVLNGNVWMVEDLMYACDGSKLSQLFKEGKTFSTRLYGELEVRNFKPCPDGWRIPTKKEWDNITAHKASRYNISYSGKHDSTSNLKYSKKVSIRLTASCPTRTN